jgi:hypothetical protein
VVSEAPVIARNLLGRLNARSPDDLQRIAAFWQVPLPGSDRGRHVGALYRAMTDVRRARSVWERLDDAARVIVRELALRDAGGQTMDEIVELTGLRASTVREAAIRLFHGGVLAREGDSQELPIGALPRLFLPREVVTVFRRVQDELDAGDLSASSLRVLLETLDEPELEEAATIWGIRVIPGQRRRGDLVGQVLRQVDSPERVDSVIAARGRAATAIWETVRQAEPQPLALDEAIGQARLTPPGPASPEHLRATTRVEDALGELETALLVLHTYRRDGSRWLFVPREVAHPGETARTVPMRQVQPLPENMAPEVAEPAPYGIAWDLLTLVREIAAHGAPVWVPGEPLSRPWQRRLNRRLWLGGDELPPRGYLGFLLYLGVAVDIVTASDQPLPAGSDRHAIRPIVTSRVREWTRLSFDAQMARLREAWLQSDAWLEGREREVIDVWGADWPGFRSRLLAALDGLDARQWLEADDLAARLAEQHPAMIGNAFTAASARAARDGLDERTAATAQVIAVELETALSWFGLVQTAPIPGTGLAVRPVLPSRSATPGASEPALAVSDEGLVTLRRPTPLQVWSLSAFGDAESLRPEATYQLRPASVGRALAAGFDLDQIVSYLEQQSGEAIPSQVLANLRSWTAGYRRVRLRRAVVLNPDTVEMAGDLRAVLAEAGCEVMDAPGPGGGLIALLPPGNDPEAEEALLAALRAAGYAGQWERAPQRKG